MEDRSFEEFSIEEYNAVLAFARVLTGDLTRAEDVSHVSFAAALEQWDTLDNPAGWIRRVAANKSHSAWRPRCSERRALNRMRSPVRVGTDLSFAESKLGGAFEGDADADGVVVLVPIESRESLDERLESGDLFGVDAYTYVAEHHGC